MISSTARYVYEVYRMKSVSLAAKKLFLSQPALSAAIKKAEQEFGSPIFDRKTLPFSLTPEGKIYMEALEQMLVAEQHASDRVLDMHENRGGTLRLATSAHLSSYVIPHVLVEFHRHFPNVSVNVIMTSSTESYSLLDRKQVDMVFRSADKFPEPFETIPLFEEKYALVMPTNTPGIEALRPYALDCATLCSRAYPAEKEIADMSLLHGLEFIYRPPNTNLYKKRRFLVGNTDIAPFVTSNISRLAFDFSLMKAGFGAFFSTDAKIATLPANTECSYFVLGTNAGHQTFALSLSPDADTSAPLAARFSAIAKQLFTCKNPLPLLSNLATGARFTGE